MRTAKSDQIKVFLIMISIFLVASVNTKVNANESPAIDLDKSTVLITGSNRGIGLSLAENYAEQGWNVIATCRNPDKAIDLISLRGKYDNVNIEQLDVTSQKQINALAEKYKGIPIDVLLNNAGILGDTKDQVFGALNEETFEQVFAVNTFAPLKVSEAFVEHVSLSEQKKIVSMTSGLGSMQITANQSYFYFYRMSKAALNMAVVATCRKPDKATDLISLKEKYDNVNIEQLDVTSQKQINALAEKYKGIPIDVLLNNAGILGDIRDQVFGALNEETFEQVFAVNTLAPLKVSEAFVEHVSLSEQKKIVSMTSGLGSMQITANQSYFYFYRMSKAALNMAVVAMNASLRNQGIISALIAPGQVDTKLLEESGYRGPNKITPDESAKSLIRIIDSLSQETINKNGNKAINVDDRVLPW